MKDRLVAIRVDKLKTSQKEIGLQNSLDWVIGQVDVEQYYGTDPKMISSPIITYGKEYVIDGHHRWSQFYIMNSKAYIIAYIIKKKKKSHTFFTSKEDVKLILRRLQTVIGYFFG